MAKTHFSKHGVDISLSKEEFIFVYQVFTYVLYIISLTENEFRSILGMSRSDADRMVREIEDDEKAAKEAGNHWNPRPVR